MSFMTDKSINSASTIHKGTSAIERLLLAACAVIFLVALLIIAILFPEVTAFQEFVFRTVLSLAAGAAAAFIPGFFDFKIGRGSMFALRAGGAIAVFAFVYYLNPPTLVSERKVYSHQGLVKNLEKHFFEHPADFVLNLDKTRKDELRALYIENVSGKDWSELFSKICRRYSRCLVCDPEPGKIVDQVTLKLIGPPLRNHKDSQTGKVKVCISE